MPRLEAERPCLGPRPVRLAVRNSLQRTDPRERCANEAHIVRSAHGCRSPSFSIMTGRKRLSFIYRTFAPGLLYLTSRIFLGFDEATQLYLLDDERDLLN